MTGLIILGFFALLLAILFARALALRPVDGPAAVEPLPDAVDAMGAAERLSALIRKRSVSSREKDGWDPREFEAFRTLLPELYPESHRVMELSVLDGHSMLYKWKGSETGEPLVLMSHYDVVPADDEGWERPPFSGDIHEGKVWGRGSIDTKSTLVCAFEAAEILIKSGFKPKHDVYLSFGHNEETGGGGTPAIVDYLRQKNLRPSFVLDEGGAVVKGVFPGVSKPMAMIGLAEKGVTDVELLVRSPGGHSSTPPRRGGAWRLARAIMRIEQKPFPARFPGVTREMFRRLGPHASFGLRLVIANLWLFEALLLWLFHLTGGELNAICRTTTAVTMLEGSRAANVLPTSSRAVVNIRIAIGETVEGTMRRLADIIADPLVELRVLLPGEPSPVSVMDGEQFAALSQTIHELYPEAIVAPYVVLGGTDARHYAGISPNVYRFSPFELSRAERASMHAVNEAIPVATLAKGVEFYLRLIRRAG